MGIGSDVGGMVGGWIGDYLSQDSYGQGQAARQAALDAITNQWRNVPKGVVTQGGTAYDGIQANPQIQAARMQALQALAQKGAEGYNATDRAAVNDTMNQVNGQERGNREAIMRKVSPNSGAYLAAQLSNQQNAAQNANQQGLQIAGNSRMAALQAISQGGQLANQMSQQDFNQQAARANASDAINKFNTQNSNDFNQAKFADNMDIAKAQQTPEQQLAQAYDEAAKRTYAQAKGTGTSMGGIADFAMG